MKKYCIILLLMIELFPTISCADVLIIDRISESQSIKKPARGLTKAQVITEFGQPQHKNSPVGKPPITVWKYQNFTVYFEKKWVINSVINRINTNKKGSKSIR